MLFDKKKERHRVVIEAFSQGKATINVRDLGRTLIGSFKNT
jgi:hypothetical protein